MRMDYCPMSAEPCQAMCEEKCSKHRLQVVDNVTVLRVLTTQDIECERVLQAAIDAKLKYVLVIGEDDDGQLYFASSKSDGGDALWWMEKAKHALMKVTE